MTIYINNEPKEIEEETSIQHLFSTIKILSDKGIAVAINEVVVPRADWPKKIVNSNDKVLIIKATQGG
ncbi:MAG TPA: sulfur carrier protein ThiS [Cytophagaceae bacterium]|jgi:sulfur carrier protein